jgi:hypothetical protein
MLGAFTFFSYLPSKFMKAELIRRLLTLELMMIDSKYDSAFNFSFTV